MDSIVDKLSEIETAATSIVEHAETQKFTLEKDWQEKRNEFDQNLEVNTTQKLAEIRVNLEKEMARVLDTQALHNTVMIEKLKTDFDENHTTYAQAILKKIIEVS
ncbi:MAG: hypothetical protein RSA90_07085 [Lachnospiraceae bacterium]